MVELGVGEGQRLGLPLDQLDPLGQRRDRPRAWRGPGPASARSGRARPPGSRSARPAPGRRGRSRWRRPAPARRAPPPPPRPSRAASAGPGRSSAPRPARRSAPAAPRTARARAACAGTGRSPRLTASQNMARPATSSLRRVKLLWAAGLLALAVLCPSQRASARVIAATPAGGLAGALAQAHAGDTIELAPGTYREHDLVLRQSGVRILGAGATLAGPGVGAGANGLSVEGADKIAISGLTISGFDWGLLLDSGSRISLRRLTLTGNETGLRATGGADSGAVSGLLVSHLRSEHNRLLGFDCSPGPCNGLRIDHSSFSYNGADNDTAADGVGFEPGSANIRVTASRAIGNAGDGFDFKARNVAVIGSRAQDNRRNGIKLWQGGKIVNSVSTGNGLAGLVLEPDPSFGRVRVPGRELALLRQRLRRRRLRGVRRARWRFRAPRPAKRHLRPQLLGLRLRRRGRAGRGSQPLLQPEPRLRARLARPHLLRRRDPLWGLEPGNRGTGRGRPAGRSATRREPPTRSFEPGDRCRQPPWRASARHRRAPAATRARRRPRPLRDPVGAFHAQPQTERHGCARLSRR